MRRSAHGGHAVSVPLTGDLAHPAHHGELEILRVHEALTYLAGISSHLARVVEMRYSGGMSELDIAAALGSALYAAIGKRPA